MIIIYILQLNDTSAKVPEKNIMLKFPKNIQLHGKHLIV